MPHVRKSKLTEKRFELYPEHFIDDPASYAGNWKSLAPCAKKLHVDLGCGKGLWMSRVAQADQDSLYIGIDYERMCISFALEQAHNAQVRNAFFVFDTARNLSDLFAPGEIDVLHINFPTPFPRKKQAHNRITDISRLMEYRNLLNEHGQLHLKTDSQPLFDFTLEQLEAAGYETLWLTRDMHANSAGATGNDMTMSAYEEKLVAEGAKVHALHAIPGEYPEGWQPSEKTSLVDYLPADLSEMSYVPHGMQGTIENMRNRQRNQESRLNRKA